MGHSIEENILAGKYDHVLPDAPQLEAEYRQEGILIERQFKKDVFAHYGVTPGTPDIDLCWTRALYLGYYHGRMGVCEVFGKLLAKPINPWRDVMEGR